MWAGIIEYETGNESQEQEGSFLWGKTLPKNVEIILYDHQVMRQLMQKPSEHHYSGVFQAKEKN